ncbi:MAG TPA: M36 family metallopeptidase, partial [Saprospiraceae bacterium]|nr:M36 family metallopeptidase [Saprospiraceae bacterium]
MNLLHFPRLWLAAGLFLIVTIGAEAQTAGNPRETALRFLQGNPAQFNLSKADVSDVRITDEYLSKHNGITHVWVQQQYQGIPLFNGLFGLHVKPDGSVLTVGHRFVRDLASKINTTIPSLSAAKAVEMAFANLGFTGFPVPSLRQKINERNFIFEGGAVSTRDIAVSACYELRQDGSVRLAWTLVIAQANTSDIWTMRVDAQTGAILSKYNRTVSCETGQAHSAGELCSDEAPAPVSDPGAQNADFTAAESYNVFALPTESPSFGSRQIVVNPADPAASPFGWHDINGAAGAEYTYTRGNNVYAFDDRDNNNQPPATPFPNAGASLSFNYPFNPDAEPLDNLNAAITNLFYMNNKMHDITYRYGFDEMAGNFQTNNYGNGGAGDDAVQANAIDGYAASSQKVNNADFSTDPDGYDARMQMFVWTRGGQSLTVNSPAPVAGVYTTSGTQSWGADITDVPVTGQVVIADDGTGTALGCDPLVNNLTGKVAMIDRGDCQFGVKALNAQNAGAIGCIICNTEPGYVIMSAGTSGGDVDIPVIMLSVSDCQVLRQYVSGGLNVSFVLPPTPGPSLLDGDFDNGIIAHEYGHGISNRLTGGPANTDCLFNGEQMGEGWSDFFTLITTLKPGDVAATPRGIGTYVLRHPTDGIGIRRYPYTTDMNVNPVTYESVAENPESHARGEVWTAVTWDLYWAMVEKYGFDADITNVNSGNGRAI